MDLQVETRQGVHGEREPVAFMLGEHRIEVIHVIDRWLAADHNYFKIIGSDQATYILQYLLATREWDMTLFQAPT